MSYESKYSNAINKKLIICGDRNWSNEESIRSVLNAYNDYTVITGGCTGADTIAHSIAKQLGMKTIVVPADWSKHGRAAGPIRNQAMADLKPDIVFGFHSDISKSKGTKNMQSICKKNGIKFILYVE